MLEKYKELHDKLAEIGNWEILRQFKSHPDKTPSELVSDIYDLTMLISDVLLMMEELEKKISKS